MQAPSEFVQQDQEFCNGRLAALLQDLDTYLKLAPQGRAAPQVRKLREQLVKYMDAQPKPVAKP